jgi:hypothetical protein
VWDEHKFVAGRLSNHEHIRFWEEVVLVGHPEKDRLLEAMRGMRPHRYFKRYRGRFAGKYYDCEEPPPRVFRNNWPTEPTSTGQSAEEWALGKIEEDVRTGALIRVGTVGVDPPPKVVLPLTVEVSKPRLIHDGRYTNLWQQNNGFTMGKVASIPETFNKKSWFLSYDHKSGYHAFPFAEDSREYFGMEAGGHYYVPGAGIFGWNVMPEIYHLAHEALLSFAAALFGIPSLVYLDDSITGSIWNREGDPSKNSSAWCMEILLWLNFLAGYTISIKKSVLRPVRFICWLGINIDSLRCVFSVPREKKDVFLAIVKQALSEQRITIRDLERVAGKAISFWLAVGEAARVFTREMFNVLASVHGGRMAHSKNTLRLSPRLVKVLEVWVRFLDTFDGAPWMQTMHSVLRIETDASSRRWGGVLREGGSSTIEVGEEFSLEEMGLHIEAKEAIAVTRVIEEIAKLRGWQFLSGKRIDAWIDNLPLVFALGKGSSSMREVHDEVEKLFWWKLEHHFSLGAIWWDTHANFRADGITRTEVDGDWRLSREGFLLVWARWGPFDMDLMASSVSVQRDMTGQALPFFSRFRSPGCAGVNVLAQVLGNGSFYCFPPAQMIGPVVCHLANLREHMRLVLIEKTMPRAVGSWATRVQPCIQGKVVLPADCVKDHNGHSVGGMFVGWLLEF